MLCCISWGYLDLLRPGEFEPDQNYVASWKYFCEGEGRGSWGMAITDIFPLRILGNRFKSFLPAILFAINRSTYFDM